MCAALKPPSLDVHRAASRLPNFRIRRSATKRPPATPGGREGGLQVYLTLLSNGVASTQSVGVSQKGKSEHP